MINKKSIALTAVAVLAFGLTGCASQAAAPTVTVTEAPADTWTDTTPAASNEDLFLAAVYAASDGNYIIDNAGDEAILNAGQATCDVFDQGYTLSDVVQVLAGNNPSSEEATAYGIVIGAAATSLCPEYAYKVQ